ncbi:MAG: acetylornithine deacetylase [Candidatus Parabeggiatoa sp. nov. 2]|nr:MAG: acetylornithine deacetylase [Beggiatoa sp. 4572_84]RKZ60164.1 MAG: acetylornithine deacetylase [Gammaproteobacteria bacterium]
MTAKIPSVLTMISELIAIPSVSCVNQAQDQSNQAVIERLANWCNDLGFNTDILPVPNHPGKFNLVATLGSGDGGLVLAGHTDTVPYDAGRWQNDPFRLTEADNRLYGLGTADMKAFFALALTAAAPFSPLLSKAPFPSPLSKGNKGEFLRQPLIILATADEESTMSGARALVAAGHPKARYAVIGEPTGLRPVRMHKGIFMEAIRLRGQSGHSSDPSLGNNALEGIYQVIGELLKWRKQLQATHVNPLFHIPVPTMNLGHLHGGDNPNRICADCELQLDLRPLPGMDMEELRAVLRQRVQQVLEGSGLEIEFVPLSEGTPAMETSAQTEIVQVAERLTKHTASAVAFGTEAPYLTALGMDTIVLGPGDIAQAHQPDEFIALNRLQPMIDVLTQLIRHFCLG